MKEVVASMAREAVQSVCPTEKKEMCGVSVHHEQQCAYQQERKKVLVSWTKCPEQDAKLLRCQPGHLWNWQHSVGFLCHEGTQRRAVILWEQERVFALLRSRKTDCCTESLGQEKPCDRCDGCDGSPWHQRCRLMIRIPSFPSTSTSSPRPMLCPCTTRSMGS